MMKKFLLLAISIATITPAVFAGTEPEVNRAVQNAFHRQFGNMTLVSWKKANSGEINIGQYLKNGVRKEAFFNQAGKFIGEGQYVSTESLPKTIQKIAARTFKKYELTEAYEFYYANSDIPVYGLAFENEKEKYQVKIDEFGNLVIINKAKIKHTQAQNQSSLKVAEGFDIEAFKD
jgi:hypothetical protein